MKSNIIFRFSDAEIFSLYTKAFRKVTSIILILLLFGFSRVVNAQIAGIPEINFKNALIEAGMDASINKKKSEYTKADWQAIIDTTWGEGDPTDKKLAVFDEVWNKVDRTYPCFQNLDIDWEGLKNKYRPEIEAGVSQGRFVGILNSMTVQLMDTHFWLYNIPINLVPELEPGMPVFSISSYSNNRHFGATLYPMPDSSLLVYKAFPNHPLGLVPGDVVIGYEGVPWKELYKDLLTAQLPLRLTGITPSTKEAYNQVYLSSAGLNWHLYDTIDIVKYDSGDTLHLPTSLLAGQKGRIMGSDQLQVNGVDFWIDEGTNVISRDTTIGFYWEIPDIMADYVTYGVLENTHVGYIYVTTASNDFVSSLSTKILQAFKSLDNDSIEGIIFDMRYNTGGIVLMDEVLNSIYTEGFSLFSTFDRASSQDHFLMKPWYFLWGLDKGTNTYHVRVSNTDRYNKPIAILTGPACVSAGEYIIQEFKNYNPLRIFGKNTAGAMTIGNEVGVLSSSSEWKFGLALANTRLPGDSIYNSHRGIAVDEEVWFDRDSVAKGVDNVVSRAAEWIQNKVYPYSSQFNLGYLPPSSDITLSVHLQNPNDHTVSLLAYLKDLETSEILDSLELPLDDSNRYATPYTLSGEERSYAVSYKSKDQNSGEEQILPDVNKFTTKGPVTVDSYEVSPFSDKAGLRLYLINNGSSAPINNPMITAKRIEDCGSVSSAPVNFSGTIETGAIQELSSLFTIWKQGCENPSIMPVKVTIYENNIPFWVDTISVDLSSVGLQAATGAAPVSVTSYPNPFQCNVNFRVRVTEPQHIRLIVYNQSGHEVALLLDEFLENGNHEFTLDAGYLPEGLYFYRLFNNDRVYPGKLIKVH